MKKLLVLTLTVLTITALVGCGAKNEKVEKDDSSSTNIVEQSNNEMFLAKVKKVVGNEISVKLSDDNFNMLEGGEGNVTEGSFTLDEGQLKQLEDGGTITIGDGSIVGSVIIDPNAEDNIFSDGGTTELAEPLPIEGANGVEGETGELPHGVMIFDVDSSMDEDIFSGLEFNGDDKDLIIPAGVEIFNMKTGKSGNMSDIKEGSILSIVIDSKTNTVTRIDIMG